MKKSIFTIRSCFVVLLLTLILAGVFGQTYSSEFSSLGSDQRTVNASNARLISPIPEPVLSEPVISGTSLSEAAISGLTSIALSNNIPVEDIIVTADYTIEFPYSGRAWSIPSM